MRIYSQHQTGIHRYSLCRARRRPRKRKALLAAGVDINIPTQAEGSANRVTSQLGIPKTVGALGYTPLLVAVVRGQVDLALWLLDHGADPNNIAGGFTPLHWA